MADSRAKQRLDAKVRIQWNLSWGKARAWIETGKIWCNGQAMTDPAVLMDESDSLELKMSAPKPKTQAARISAAQTLSKTDVVYADSQIIVVNKPAGMSTVPFEKEETGTLEQQVCAYLGQSRVVVVHRLDRETSGLVVFARHAEAGKKLANQFRFHTVARRYFALAQGRVQTQTMRSELVDNRGDGLRGSVQSPEQRGQGKLAVTHVTALAEFQGMTLIECRLETGRTHQIRIHLSEAGHPLVGEKAYLRDARGQRLAAPRERVRVMLHAAELGLVHPVQEVAMRWTRLPPQDFMDLLPNEAKQLLEKRN